MILTVHVQKGKLVASAEPGFLVLHLEVSIASLLALRVLRVSMVLTCLAGDFQLSHFSPSANPHMRYKPFYFKNICGHSLYQAQCIIIHSQRLLVLKRA